VVVALLMLSSSARADPFTVTGGTIRIPTAFGSATFALEGDGFSLSGHLPQFVGSLSCFPCSSATPITIHGPMSDITFGGLPGTFNNISYPALFFTGLLTVASPPFPGSMLLESPTVMVPFDFTGLLVGFHTAAEAFGPGVPIFTANLTGAGTVTANFSAVPVDPGGTPIFDLASATFDFNAVLPEPTPEPATLALFAMGGAGAVFLRRRRR
jgi:hypothetical protein